MTPYLARIFKISLNNTTIPSDWKRATVVPNTKEVIDEQSQTTDP
jgi:hypothetical protein